MRGSYLGINRQKGTIGKLAYKKVWEYGRFDTDVLTRLLTRILTDNRSLTDHDSCTRKSFRGRNGMMREA